MGWRWSYELAEVARTFASVGEPEGSALRPARCSLHWSMTVRRLVICQRDRPAPNLIPASRYSSFTGTGRAGRTLAVMWLSVSDTTLYLPTQRQSLDRMRNGQ